jgi:hypothetical protein
MAEELAHSRAMLKPCKCRLIPNHPRAPTIRNTALRRLNF